MTIVDILVGTWIIAIDYFSHAWWCIAVGFIVAGIFSEFVSRDTFLRILGSGKWYSYFMATAAGGVLGVCSCAILPLFAGIRRRGAGVGPAVTFLIAGPSINPVGVLLTIGLLNVGLGIARIIGAVIIAIAVGVVVDLVFGKEEIAEAKKVLKVRRRKPKVVLSFASKMKKAMTYTWDYVKEILWLIVIGVFVAALLRTVIPPVWIESTMGSTGLTAYLIAAFIGIPLFVIPPVEIPLAATFLALGMSPGAALVFLLAAPTISIATLMVVVRVLKWERTLVYALGVYSFSILLGLLFFPILLQFTTAGAGVGGDIYGTYHDVILLGLLAVAIIAAYIAHNRSMKKIEAEKAATTTPKT